VHHLDLLVLSGSVISLRLKRKLAEWRSAAWMRRCQQVTAPCHTGRSMSCPVGAANQSELFSAMIAKTTPSSFYKMT
jgi:hypothetical protein